MSKIKTPAGSKLTRGWASFYVDADNVPIQDDVILTALNSHDELVEALRNIASLKRSECEDRPMYWLDKIVGDCIDILAKIAEVK